VMRIGDYLLVSEDGNHRIQVFKEGRSVATFGEEGIEEGQFKNPAGMARSGTTLFVADGGNHRLQAFSLV